MKPVVSKQNLRSQQRVEAQLDVLVSAPSGQAVPCRTINLSRAGMMLSCDNKTLHQLVPGRKAPAPGQWVDIMAKFSVPVVASQNVTISADCNLIHLRRVSRDEFHVGIQFCSFEGNGQSYVDQFVSRQLSILP
ncbi:MAG: PilZ domain-containing protein [Marinobacter sp.]|uniref:PilZ domain-containing protein n=1 Tax=Marinobacter sp. TaxID=50741 RepID=UPI0034A0185E